MLVFILDCMYIVYRTLYVEPIHSRCRTKKDLCRVVSVERVERRPLAGTTGIVLLLDDFDVGLSRYKCIRNQLK